MTNPKYISTAQEMEAYRLRLGYTQGQMGALMSMSRGNYARMECEAYGMRAYHLRILRMLKFLERRHLLKPFADEIFTEHGL